MQERTEQLQDLVRLVMHGIPERWLDNATAEDIQILWNIVNLDSTEKAKLNGAATWGGLDN